MSDHLLFDEVEDTMYTIDELPSIMEQHASSDVIIALLGDSVSTSSLMTNLQLRQLFADNPSIASRSSLISIPLLASVVESAANKHPDGTPLSQASTSSDDSSTSPSSAQQSTPSTETSVVESQAKKLPPIRLTVLELLFSGAIAGAVGKTIVAPIDRVKLLYMVNPNRTLTMANVKKTFSTIFKNTGMRGLFKGNASAMWRVLPYSSTTLASYDVYENFFYNTFDSKKEHPLIVRFMAGAGAGTTATLLTYPFDLVRARAAAHWNAQPLYNSALSAIASIYRTDGLKALYNGVMPTMYGIVPYGGLSFAVFVTIKDGYLKYINSQRLKEATSTTTTDDSNNNNNTNNGSVVKGSDGKEKKAKDSDIPHVVRFIAGGLAGMVATTAVQPLQIIRRRMQVGDLVAGMPAYQNTWDAVKQIYTTEGFRRGLFKGLLLTWGKTPIAMSITFFINDKLKHMGERYHHNARESWLEAIRNEQQREDMETRQILRESYFQSLLSTVSPQGTVSTIPLQTPYATPLFDKQQLQRTVDNLDKARSAKQPMTVPTTMLEPTDVVTIPELMNKLKTPDVLEWSQSMEAPSPITSINTITQSLEKGTKLRNLTVKTTLGDTDIHDLLTNHDDHELRYDVDTHQIVVNEGISHSIQPSTLPPNKAAELDKILEYKIPHLNYSAQFLQSPFVASNMVKCMSSYFDAIDAYSQNKYGLKDLPASAVPTVYSLLTRPQQGYLESLVMSRCYHDLQGYVAKHPSVLVPTPAPQPNNKTVENKSQSSHTSQYRKLQAPTLLMVGGIAGIISKTTIAPADNIKILYQVSQKPFSLRGALETGVNIAKNHGPGALWRGNMATMIRVAPYASITYTTYDYYLEMVNRVLYVEPPNVQFNLHTLDASKTQEVKGNWTAPGPHDTLARFIAGGLSGSTSTILTYPLDLMRARMAANIHTVDSPYRTYVKGFSYAVRTDGVTSLWGGLKPTLLGIFPYAGLSFSTYHTLKAMYVEHKRITPDQVPVLVQLSSGAVAALVAQSLTYPLDILRRRNQVGTFTNMTVVQSVQHIFKHEGWRGFFKGLSMNWIKGPVASAVSFAVNDRLKLWLSKTDWA